MSAWHKNTGTAPRQIVGVPITRVFVDLRNGLRPAESWRGETTRWSLTGAPFDIIAWKPA